MRKKSYIWVNIVIYIYMVLPTLIFVIGWLRWYWALGFSVLISFACLRGFMDSAQNNYWVIEENYKTFLKALLFIVGWVYLSGIGGWCYQNSDHEVRSAIFRALVEYDWPVISNNGERGLIYYIGFWLPAACVGKVFGIEAGYATQFIWAVLGIFMVYYLICTYRKKVDLWPMAFLILFSGLDYVGTWILGQEGINLNLAAHLEWWAADFQFTSMTSQLFWVFNQAIPAWLATMMISVQKDCKNILFILSLCMLSSTIPFVGLIPIVIYFYIKRVITDRTTWNEVFTFQNVVGVLIVGGCAFLYLIGNISGGMVKQDNASLVIKEPMAGLLRYLLFYFLEFGVYLYFIYKYKKKKSLLYLIVAILLVCPFIKVGVGHDFCMRASVPALFILMLMCMDTLEKIYLDNKRYMLVAYGIVLILGSITAFNEIHRSIRETFVKVTAGESVRYPEIDIESQVLQYGNFSGETGNNIFYKYFARAPYTYNSRE